MSTTQKQDQIMAAAKDPKRHGVAFFASILESEVDPLCRWYALKAIGDLKGIDAKDQLLSVLQQPDYEFDESSLHRICARAIGQIGSVLSTDIINLLKTTSSQQTRVALIDALGEIADPAAVPVLSEQLVSQTRAVKLWAALSLAKIGEVSLPVFSSALAGADAELVFIIADALAIIGTEKTLPVLLEAIDKDPETVRAYFSKGSIERTSAYTSLIKGSQIASASEAIRDLLTKCEHQRP